MVLCVCALASARADEQFYLCELGFQAGCGYYAGDATPHIFNHPREAYGLFYRYKFTRRWAIQAKVSGQRITGNDFTIRGEKLDTKWQTQLINADVTAEFNFFRFGSSGNYDARIRPYTPYIFIGLGVGMYNGEWWMPGSEKHGVQATAYVPLGVGFKWKFSEHCGMNVAWQHNIYMADNIECRDALDNKHQLNGWNWMNCDVTGMLTVGLMVEFAPAPKACRICNW